MTDPVAALNAALEAVQAETLNKIAKDTSRATGGHFVAPTTEYDLVPVGDVALVFRRSFPKGACSGRAIHAPADGEYGS